MTSIQALPLELKHCVFTYLDSKDVARLRLVNKEALQQVDDSVFLPPYITLTSGSRWYQCHFRCHWCDDSVPFNSEICKQFRSCQSCLDDVVKTCHNCQQYPVSVLDMMTCRKCDMMWCYTCVMQLWKLYIRNTCEFEEDWVCFHCLMADNLLRVCDGDSCDQLMCACRSCTVDNLHSDVCMMLYCSRECAQDCACFNESVSDLED